MKLIVFYIILLFSFGFAKGQDLTLVNIQGMPGYIVKELRAIAKESNESRIEISSKQRTVKKQVEIMLNYYIILR